MSTTALPPRLRTGLIALATTSVLSLGVLGGCTSLGGDSSRPATSGVGEAPVATTEPASRDRFDVVLTDVSELVDAVAGGVVAVSRGQFRFQVEDLLQSVFVPAGVGTGIVIDDAGHILTNYHVIAGAQAVTITLRNGDERAATIIGEAPDLDLALLAVDDHSELQPIAIAIDTAKPVIDEFLAGRGGPFIGVRLVDNSPQLAAQLRLASDRGAVIAAVTPGPGFSAGLRPGDVVTAVDGAVVLDADDLVGAIAATTPGTDVVLRVVRGVEQLELTVTVGRRPALVDSGDAG